MQTEAYFAEECTDRGFFGSFLGITKDQIEASIREIWGPTEG
jgi:hypothetical protein